MFCNVVQISKPTMSKFNFIQKQALTIKFVIRPIYVWPMNIKFCLLPACWHNTLLNTLKRIRKNEYKYIVHTNNPLRALSTINRALQVFHLKNKQSNWQPIRRFWINCSFHLFWPLITFIGVRARLVIALSWAYAYSSTSVSKQLAEEWKNFFCVQDISCEKFLKKIQRTNSGFQRSSMINFYIYRKATEIAKLISSRRMLFHQSFLSTVKGN